MTKQLPRISFIGIGLMGMPMASRILSAGYPLVAWNRTYEKALPLKAKGATIATSLEEASHADIIITILSAGPAVIEVIKQLLPSLKPSTLIIDMSSTQQGEALHIAKLLNEKKVRFLDAPVSGGVVGATEGTLAIMVGGKKEDFDFATPLFQVMGRPTLVGPNGAGQLAKLCNQLIVGGTIGIVSEALLLAKAGGADPAAVRDAIRGGFAESRVLEVHGKRMIDRTFIPGAKVETQLKDQTNILLAAKDASLQLPITELVTNLYQSIVENYREADHSAGALAIEQLNLGKKINDKKEIFKN